MAVIIGSARHDENYAYYNGKPGDQLQSGNTDDWKGEVALEDFYVHSKGWYILRAKSGKYANALASAMKKACNNANLGYSMGGDVATGRYGVIKYGTASTVKCNCDCSSLVRRCVIEATGTDPGDFSTSGEPYALTKTGLFNQYTYGAGMTIYTGDILVTRSQGHTVICVTGAKRDGGDDPQPTPQPTGLVFTYAVKTKNHGILPAVTNLNDYAGIENDPIIGLAIKSNQGSVKYRVHNKNGSWLPYVTGYNWNDANNGYAGSNREIDLVEVILSGVNGQQAQYRVSPIGSTGYYDWQLDNNKSKGMDGYAGAKGKSIDKFQIY